MPTADNVVQEIANFRSDAPSTAEYKFTNAAIVIALQKRFNTPFVAPLDVNTGTPTTNLNLRNRYWSVFHADAFSAFRRPRIVELRDGLHMVVHALSPRIGIWRAIRWIVGAVTRERNDSVLMRQNLPIEAPGILRLRLARRHRSQ